MARVYNFSAGPSMLPESVLKKAAAEMLDYEGSGQSGTQRVIETALPDCTVLQGLAVQGKTAQENEVHTRELLTSWLAGLNLIK